MNTPRVLVLMEQIFTYSAQQTIIHSQQQAYDIFLKLKTLSDLLHNLISLSPRSLFVKQRCNQLLHLQIRSVERFLLLSQHSEPSIDHRQYFSRIFTQLRHQIQDHNYQIHFQVNNSYEVQLLYRDFGSIQTDTTRLNAQFLKQFCDLLKNQIFPKHPETFMRSLSYNQCTFMLSYPYSLSRQDTNHGMSLKLISNQILIERGYDIHTGALLKCKMIIQGKQIIEPQQGKQQIQQKQPTILDSQKNKQLPRSSKNIHSRSNYSLTKLMGSGPFPKSALAQFLQRSFHISNSEDVFIFQRRFGLNWGASSFLSYMLNLQKRNLNNIVLLINKSTLTSRDPYFNFDNNTGQIISNESVPFRYSQSVKVSHLISLSKIQWFFGRFGKQGTVPGAMTASAIAFRKFQNKCLSFLKVFFYSILQNLTKNSTQAQIYGEKNAQIAMNKVLGLTKGIVMKEKQSVDDNQFDNQPQFNDIVYKLIQQSVSLKNYDKMPVSWAAWV